MTSVTLPGGGTLRLRLRQRRQPHGDHDAQPGAGPRVRLQRDGPGARLHAAGRPAWTRRSTTTARRRAARCPAAAPRRYSRKPDGRLTGATRRRRHRERVRLPGGDGTAASPQATRTLPGGRVDAMRVRLRRRPRSPGASRATRAAPTRRTRSPTATTCARARSPLTAGARHRHDRADARRRRPADAATGRSRSRATGPSGLPSTIADGGARPRLGYDAVGRRGHAHAEGRRARRLRARAHARRGRAHHAAGRRPSAARRRTLRLRLRRPTASSTTVKDGATTLEAYAYDANGNRSQQSARPPQTATYDARTDCCRAAPARLHVRRRRVPDRRAARDTFAYSDAGELLQAHGRRRRPSATSTTALGRRIAARIEGGHAPSTSTATPRGRSWSPAARARRAADDLLLRARRPAVRAPSAAARPLLRRDRPGRHAERGHRRRRHGRQDARLRRVRREPAARRQRARRSSCRSASPAASRTASPGSCASACATTSRRPGAGPRATRSCSRRP